ETSIPGWRDLGGSSVALSPDGTLLAFVGEGEGEGEGVRGVRLLDRRTLELRPIPRTEDAFTIFFSPDGQKVGFVTRQFIVKTTSLLGETQRTLAERATRLGADWGHDGYVYFAVGNTSGGQPGLRRVPANGGPVESLTQVDTAAGEIGHYWPQLLPGGRGVLFTIWRDRLYDASTMDIAVVDLKTRSYRPLLKGVTARAIGPGFIVVITAAGAILGVPFDEQRLRIGRPVTLREGVEVDRFGNTNVAASANGTLIYAAGAGRQMHELVWVDRAGAAQSVDSGWVGEFTVARVSPDGKSLAASIVSGAEEQIWVHDLLRDTRRQLRVEGANIGRLRSWTPDGRAVAFWKGYTLTTLPVDGGAQSEWIQRGWPGSISFSPDGDQVVYTSAQGGHRDLYSARRGDSVPQPLVATAHAETGGEIAPDGRWLAYVSDESGRSEVYVRPFPPDRGTTTWPVTSDGGTEPRWSHTGRELFYRSGSNLMVAEVTLGATFRMGRHQQLFPIDGFGGGYDVGPDDRRFLMIRPVGSHGGDTKMVIVMDNVLEELKARTGK
ncbi:MAG: hypothetical protein OEW56_11130, partial [Gemmatimonadota bacterium]|nr:hypothetical protein [Gemmatimonadota bacterium]